MFEVRVINLCDRDIATNFGAVAGEVVLVDLLIFLFALIVIYFSEKETEKQNFCLLRYCSFTAVVLFKTDFLVEFGIGLLFPEGKRCSKQG